MTAKERSGMPTHMWWQGLCMYAGPEGRGKIYLAYSPLAYFSSANNFHLLTALTLLYLWKVCEKWKTDSGQTLSPCLLFLSFFDAIRSLLHSLPNPWMLNPGYFSLSWQTMFRFFYSVVSVSLFVLTILLGTMGKFKMTGLSLGQWDFSAGHWTNMPGVNT